MISEERRLTERAAAGSREALGSLLGRYEPRLTAYVRSRIRRPEEAEDCLQDIRLRVTRSIQRFENGAEFAPWLFAIAANAVRNAATRTRRHAPLEATPADGTPDAPGRLVIAESKRAVRAALDRLPERYARAIELRVASGLSHREVARRIGVSEGAARVLFCRALRALRDELGGEP